VSDRLSSFFQTNREKFLQCWEDVEMVVKLGILQDEKFYERAKEFLVWKNLDGQWTTVSEYLERNKESCKGKIFYCPEEKQNGHFIDLYKEKGIEVLIAGSLIDTPLMDNLEHKLDDVKFQRIDGGIDEAILDASREKTLLDTDGKTEAVKIADFIRTKLKQDQVLVEAKSLASDAVPAFIVLDEDMRRLRETMALTQQTLPNSITSRRTFVVNTNSKLIQAIYGLKDKSPELAKEMTEHLFDLSLLSQKELDPAALSDFVSRSNRVLENLITQKSLVE